MSDVVADLIRAALDVADYTSELESHPHSASVFVRRDRALRKAAEAYRTAQPPAQAEPVAENVGLLVTDVLTVWDVFTADMEWFATFVSPLNWDAWAVYKRLVAEGYEQSLHVQLRSRVGEGNPVAVLTAEVERLRALQAEPSPYTEQPFPPGSRARGVLLQAALLIGELSKGLEKGDPTWEDLQKFGRDFDAVMTGASDTEQQRRDAVLVAWCCPNDPDTGSAFYWHTPGVDRSGQHCDNCGSSLMPLYSLQKGSDMEMKTNA